MRPGLSTQFLKMTEMEPEYVISPFSYLEAPPETFCNTDVNSDKQKWNKIYLKGTYGSYVPCQGLVLAAGRPEFLLRELDEGMARYEAVCSTASVLGNDWELILINSFWLLLLELAKCLEYPAQGPVLSLIVRGMLLMLKQSIDAEP